MEGQGLLLRPVLPEEVLDEAMEDLEDGATPFDLTEIETGFQIEDEVSQRLKTGSKETLVDHLGLLKPASGEDGMVVHRFGDQNGRIRGRLGDQLTVDPVDQMEDLLQVRPELIKVVSVAFNEARKETEEPSTFSLKLKEEGRLSKDLFIRKDEADLCQESILKEDARVS